MRIVITFLLVTFSLTTFALDLDRENISVSYLQLPSEPMVKIEDRTYSVLYNSAYHENEFQALTEENFHIEGFQRLFSGASILVEFQFDELEVLSTEVLSKKRKVKDVDGKLRIEFYYIPIFKYRTYAKVIVSYANGRSKSYKFGLRNNQYTGEERYSTSEANKVLSNDIHKIVHDIFSQFLLETVKNMDNLLSKKHGYQVVDTTDYLLILDSKKIPEYNDYKRYYSLVDRVFKQMSPFVPLNNIRNEMQPVLTFLKRIPEIYTSDKKTDVKMRYASYYNLGKIYYYLDELEQSIDYYQKVIENDYREGQSKRNIKDIINLLELFNINQVNTRHFPLEQQQAAAQTYQQQDEFIYLDAEIQMIEGDLLEGKIELNANIQDPIWELQNLETISFKFLNDDDEIETKLFYSEFIDFIQLEEVKLQRISFIAKPEDTKQIYAGKTSKSKTVNALAVELFNSDKVALYKFQDELVLKKANETIGQSTSSVAFSFAFKKKLGKFFADCTDLKAQIKSGKYRNNARDLIQAIKDYSQCHD